MRVRTCVCGPQGLDAAAGGKAEGMAAVAAKKGDTDLFNMQDLVKVPSLIDVCACIQTHYGTDLIGGWTHT